MASADVPLRSSFQKGLTAQLQGVWLADSLLYGLPHLLGQHHGLLVATPNQLLGKTVAKVTLSLTNE